MRCCSPRPSITSWSSMSSPEPRAPSPEARVKRIAILGSTGSIGRSALAVADAHADRLSVVGLGGGENAELLAEQIVRYKPKTVAMASGAALDRLRAIGAGDAALAGS